MQQRPKAITVLAVLAVLGGILSFMAGMILMFSGGLGTAAGAPGGWTVMAFGSLMFTLGLVSFFLGYGFWMQKRWAWSVAVVVYGVGIVMNVASVLLAGATPFSVVVPVVIGAAVIWYLMQPQTKAALGR